MKRLIIPQGQLVLRLRRLWHPNTIRPDLLCVYRAFFPINIFRLNLQMPNWLIVAIAWLCYYGGVLVWNIGQGTAFNRGILEWIHQLGVSDLALTRFSQVLLAHPELNPTITDKTHTAFSFILLPVAGWLALRFMDVANETYNHIWDTGIIQATADQHRQFIADLQRRCDRLRYTFIAVVMGGIMWTTFVYMANRSDLNYWWGNIRYGYAGYYLGLVMGVLTYAAVRFLLIILENIMAIRRIVAYPLRPRPLHPDRCSGFSPLGRLIYHLYAIVAWGGVVIFVVYIMGYFGLEKTFTFVLVIAIYTVATPVIWLMPTLTIVHRLQSEKTMLLLRIENDIRDPFEQLRQSILAQEKAGISDADLSMVERAKRMHSLFDEMPVWPFEIRRIQTIVIGNIMQIAGFIATVVPLITR